MIVHEGHQLRLVRTAWEANHLPINNARECTIDRGVPGNLNCVNLNRCYTGYKLMFFFRVTLSAVGEKVT